MKHTATPAVMDGFVTIRLEVLCERVPESKCHLLDKAVEEALSQFQTYQSVAMPTGEMKHPFFGPICENGKYQASFHLPLQYIYERLVSQPDKTLKSGDSVPVSGCSAPPRTPR